MSSSSNYIMFKKERYCPNATSIGYARPYISIGSLVRYGSPLADGNESLEYGRVMCLVRRDGCGKTFRSGNGAPTPWVCVLQLSSTLGFAYERYIPIEWIREVMVPGDFLRWFLFGSLPVDPQITLDVVKYGAMSNSYIGRYLTAPEGTIRSDWRDIARHGRVPCCGSHIEKKATFPNPVFIDNKEKSS